MLRLESQTSSHLVKTEISQRVNAFVVTSLAVFVLTCLVWPLTVTDFRSVAAINVVGAAGEEPKAKFQENVSVLVQEETTDERLDAIVTQIEATGKLNSKRIEFRDHESIRNALMVGINSNSDGFEFLLGYDGRGSADERELVNLLTARIAHRLNPSAHSKAAQQLATEFLVDDPNSIENFQANQNRRIDEATWIVDQIENDLKSVTHSIAQIGDLSNPYGSTDGNSEANSPFQYASSRKAILDTSEITGALSSIDVKSLRSILTSIRNETDLQSSLLSQEINNGDIADSRIVINKLTTSQTLPINGAPTSTSVFFVGLLSLLIGATVAWKLEPFADRGFQSADSIETKLGVPVVATIKGTINPDSSSSTAPWANRAAKLAGLGLFGIFVIVAGFVLINADVRETFFENPLYGCAKIVRIFAGY